MAHQANENIPTVCFTFEPNSLLNASVYRHAQNATAGFLKLSNSHSPAYTISSTTSIASTRTVFKDAYNRVLAQIDRKDLAKDTIALHDFQGGDKLLKAKKINEWLSDESGCIGCIESMIYGELIWRFDENFNMILCAQNDPHRILARAEQLSHLPISESFTPLKATPMVSVYSLTASPEFELQVLTSFTYLEHKMRLERKSTMLSIAVSQYDARVRMG
ncbi:hypothetical protein BT96DRAFT_917133 [Gymnopus androsaceus JB14]|uniref:DUF6593 domain-containing protein n=1 Tax=Gymnopus androsaceus JB14 TaxID=1447944 RepID=A0A6A4I1V3_9AGAR|nr:hypothetical protein BT96DRAFT_917133 [Gymnopus androsaceus JB14]